MTGAVVAVSLVIGAFFIMGAVFGAVSVVALARSRPAREVSRGGGPPAPPSAAAPADTPGAEPGVAPGPDPWSGACP